MQRIIDFHTHAFPDNLAERAVTHLAHEGGIKCYLDGKLDSLIESMEKYEIEKSVVCSIATKPKQYKPIFEWSKSITSGKIIPFPSFHPEDPMAMERIDEIKGEGFKGIKMHPFYQDFYLDEERMFPIYEKISEQKLMLVVHTGFDMAFEFIRRADPLRIVKVIEKFPALKLITTHLGAWKDWEEVERHILGKNIYMETSFSLEVMDEEKVRAIFDKHPKEYILFGTDSPWAEQGEAISMFKSLELGEDAERLILSDNAERLLESD